MRKAILAIAMLGTMISVAQAADVKLSGNVGFRNDSDKVGVTQTERDRFRAQLKVTAKTDDKTTVVVGLSTGGTKSTWNDMGGQNSLKDVNLNLAYVEYAAAPFAKVTLGKMNQPWASSALFFDNDIKPEGLAVALKEDNLGLFANAFKLKLSEEGLGKDSKLNGLQVGVKKNFADADFVVHYGLLNQELKSPPGLVCVVPLTVPSLPVCPVEKRDLKLYGFSVKKEVAGLPVVAFYEQATNDKATRLDEATAYGVTVGHAKKAGDWEVGYIHQKVEANSLSTVWTDAEFANGNVAHDGYGFRGTYAVTDSWKVRGTYYNADVGTVRPVAYKRVLLDLVYSF